jgi:hypothetical protein
MFLVGEARSSLHNVNVFVSLREESRLSVFENRVLRRIFGSTWDEVTGE